MIQVHDRTDDYKRDASKYLTSLYLQDKSKRSQEAKKEVEHIAESEAKFLWRSKGRGRKIFYFG